MGSVNFQGLDYPIRIVISDDVILRVGTLELGNELLNAPSGNREEANCVGRQVDYFVNEVMFDRFTDSQIVQQYIEDSDSSCAR